MADLSIQDLAKVVGVPVERFLEQIKEAGLPQTAAADKISNEQKSKLLAFLKSRHGDNSGGETAPGRITLKRKTVETLKTSDNQGRSKTVSVEVRKKRTYVKRSVEEAQKEAAEKERLAAEQKLREEAERKEREAAEAKRRQEGGFKPAAAAKDRARLGDPRAEPKVEPARSDAKIDGKLEFKKGTIRKDGKPGQDEEAEVRKPLSRKKEKEQAPKKFKGVRSSDDFVLDDDADGGTRWRAKKKPSQPKQHQFEKPTEFIVKEIEVPEAITVSELASRLSIKAGELIKALMKMGVMATVNQVLDQDTSVLLVEELGHKPKLISANELEDNLVTSIAHEGEAVPRAPVVTVMGHVDHGKTSLLDYIRKTSVAAGEAGGITQHIGAYHVTTERGMVSFLDTPGHAAFSAMRSRGAKATDIVILVVAADDGVMPQTEEAIQHARAANVPIVVAVNKIDKEAADPDRVKNELAVKGVIPDSWGGDTQFVEVSAITGQGVSQLLDAVLLQAEMLELKAIVDCPARGVVIESSLDKGRGALATVLVQSGTLKLSDIILVGHEYGRVRAMLDENGRQVSSAGPSIPVEILGLNGTPEAGDEFVVLDSEKQAREVAEHRLDRYREKHLAKQLAIKSENLFATMGKANKQILNIVLKADVRGSLEAIMSALAGIGNEEVAINIVGFGVGGISETDAQLAETSNATIIGFNVRADKAAKTLIESAGLQLRYYSIIYNLLDDVKAVLGGMLAPELKEEILGVAEVRGIFNSPKYGAIAGSMVVEGTIYRNKPIRVLRDNVVIFEGELESLRRFKDEASEVRSGMECGIGVKNYNDVRIGDKIEVYNRTKVARSL
ncbi:MAG: translation initiation factor IF-2 [Pseudohongiellaceae bacterium]